MILELAVLNVKPGTSEAFATAFREAQAIIASMPGYISHELHQCLESDHRFFLLVRWQRLEDHTLGFRMSTEYQQWKRLLHHFYEPFPEVEHYRPVTTGSA